jgi:hypothetical protein
LIGSPLPVTPLGAGRTEVKDHVLNDNDSLWVELRYKHFADVANQITSQLDEFRVRQTDALCSVLQPHLLFFCRQS